MKLQLQIWPPLLLVEKTRAEVPHQSFKRNRTGGLFFSMPNRFVQSAASLNIAAAAAKAFSQPPPAVTQQQTIQAKVQALRERANAALLNIATNRKVLYEIVVDLKEHYHEYGYSNPAAAVRDVLQRSKSWANHFVANIEAELGITEGSESEISQVANSVATSTVSSSKDKVDTLNKVASLPDPTVPPEQPASDPAKNGEPPNADQREKKEQYAATNTEVPRDASGCVIPQHLLPLMARAKEVTEMMHHAAKLRSLFERLQSAQDKLFRSLCRSGNVQTFMTSASSMHYALSHCLPQIVCPVCQGCGQKEHTEHQNGEKVPWCWECAGTGMVSEVHWHREWEKSIDLRKQAEVARRSA